MALTVAGFAAARATAPLVTDAAADRSFAAEVDRAATPAVPGRGLDARAYTTGLADSKTVRAVSDLLDQLPVFGTPLVSVSPLVVYTDSQFPVPVIRTSDGRQAPALAFSLGDTLSTLVPAEGGPPTSDGAADGIWVPDSTATELGIGPGDVVDLGLDYPPAAVGHHPMKTVSVTVAGIYRTSHGLPVSTGFDWQSPPIPLPTDPAGGDGPPHLLLGDTSTVMRALAAMDDIPFVTWDVSWTGAVSIEHGRDAAAALQGASNQFRNTSSPIGLEVSQAHAQPVILSSGVGSFLESSEQAAAELEPVVSSISVSAQVMTVMVLAICVWLLTRSRRREHALSVSMGAHPVRLGATAAIELLLPVIVGVGAAYAIVRWWPGLVAGDGSIDRATIHGAVRSVLWTLPLAVLVIVVSGFAAVWPLDSSSASRAKRAAGAIHGETLVVAGAIATGAQLVTQRGSALDSGTALLFPLLAVLAGSVIVVRVAGIAMRTIALRRSRRGERPRSNGRDHSPSGLHVVGCRSRSASSAHWSSSSPPGLDCSCTARPSPQTADAGCPTRRPLSGAPRQLCQSIRQRSYPPAAMDFWATCHPGGRSYGRSATRTWHPTSRPTSWRWILRHLLRLPHGDRPSPAPRWLRCCTTCRRAIRPRSTSSWPATTTTPSPTTAR